MTPSGRARPARVAVAGVIATALFAPVRFAAAAAPDPRSPDSPRLELAQEETPEDAPVSADQINKYIAVYTAMQRDHGLTVDQAASKQGLSVAQFRDIENRIERNPVAHERVLEALKKASKREQPAK